MLIYLLKSGACLAIFMAFYTFFLEKENMHLFKRYYLLGALIIAFCIPLVTLTSYIEVAPMPMVPEAMPSVVYDIPTVTQNSETNYLPIILWSIYGAGVMLFGTKFTINLLQIILKINRNPKQKSKHIIHVLLSDSITPHTFFKYIFLNKKKFEQNEIPQEVFWHEETHATQNHSIDVLFVELLQIIFWFNPLIYVAKRAIKMNHEFLADQAVLNRGISASNYQHILLAFSSNAAESPLANAINYSSTRHAIGVIKKRFTVMNTHTSKRNICLKSAVLLPLLALTLYGFSEKKEIIKPLSNETFSSDTIQDILTNNDETEALSISEIYSTMTEQQKQLPAPYPIGHYELQLKATPAEMDEYNKLAKHYNSKSPEKTVIRMKDMRRLRELHDKMNKEQRAIAEPMPNFPPPPPPSAKDGTKSWTLINETISPPPPPLAANASKKQKIVYEKAMEDYKIQRESYTYKHTNDKGEVIDIIVIPENDGLVPPPPPPLSREKQNKSEIKTGFKDDRADDPLKEKVVVGYGSVNSKPTPKQGTSVINPSIDPITVIGHGTEVKRETETIKNQDKSEELVMINGKTPINQTTTMSKDELMNAKLSINDGTIISFMLKIPGKPTQSIIGNAMNTKTKALIKEALEKDAIQIYMIKNSINQAHPPIKILIKE